MIRGRPGRRGALKPADVLFLARFKEEAIDGPLSSVALDASPDAPPVALQLKDALSRVQVHVLALFAEWDFDGNGAVSRSEFHRGLSELGWKTTPENVDVLFDRELFALELPSSLPLARPCVRSLTRTFRLYSTLLPRRVGSRPLGHHLPRRVEDRLR